MHEDSNKVVIQGSTSAVLAPATILCCIAFHFKVDAEGRILVR